MPQFDVYPNPSRQTKSIYPYLLDVQSDHLAELATRIVIPLARKRAFGNTKIQRLTPEVAFEEESLLIMTPQLSSIPAKHLQNPVGTLSHFRDQIIGAVDFAVTGI